jgi:hypothetical protein
MTPQEAFLDSGGRSALDFGIILTHDQVQRWPLLDDFGLAARMWVLLSPLSRVGRINCWNAISTQTPNRLMSVLVPDGMVCGLADKVGVTNQIQRTTGPFLVVKGKSESGVLTQYQSWL